MFFATLLFVSSVPFLLCDDYQYSYGTAEAEGTIITTNCGIYSPDSETNYLEGNFGIALDSPYMEANTSITGIVDVELEYPFELHVSTSCVPNNYCKMQNSFNISSEEELLNFTYNGHSSQCQGMNVTSCKTTYCVESNVSISFGASAQYSGVSPVVPKGVTLPLPGPTVGDTQSFQFTMSKIGVDVLMTLKTPGHTDLFYESMHVFSPNGDYHTVEFDEEEKKSSTFEYRIQSPSIWDEDLDDIAVVRLIVRNTTNGTVKFRDHYNFFSVMGESLGILIIVVVSVISLVVLIAVSVVAWRIKSHCGRPEVDHIGSGENVFLL